ncbi:MAG: hypothetical protein MZV70_16790 [Desulfobacterales bacterium]|nr:hypothetical protein [Desulfobacterales bacterium]
MEKAVFVLKMHGDPVEVSADIDFELFHVIAMNTVEPFVKTVRHLVLTVSQDGFPARRIVDIAPLDVPVPQPVVCPLDVRAYLSSLFLRASSALFRSVISRTMMSASSEPQRTTLFSQS